MKSLFIILIIVLILVAVIAAIMLPPRLKIITGYAAKSMCSCVFVAKRTPESIQKSDLNFSFVKYAKVWIDKDEKAAYSTVFRLAKRKAVYRPGLGCSLAFDEKPSELPFELNHNPQNVSDKKEQWPFGELISDTVFSEIDYDKLSSAVDNAFDRNGGNVKNTRALLVLFKDQIVAEKYATGFNKNSPQLGWSMTKSITNAMVGLLVKEGRLDIEQNALFEEWQHDERSKITLNNLLQMCSGLDWNEQYGDQSDATTMLYRENDKSAYAIAKPLTHNPGDFWEYSSGTSNILQKLIRNTIKNDPEYWQYPYKNLFNKIGMASAVMEADNTGTFIGSSYCYATPRDWTRFSMLYLHDGLWDGERILPKGWVQYSSTPALASDGVYGAHFWTNSSGKYPSAPGNMFLCQGFHGQRIFILPSMDMIIVRLGISEEDTFDFDQMLKEILAAFEIAN